MWKALIQNFKKETGITKFKEKCYKNTKLKIFVLLSLIILSGVCLFLSNQTKKLGKTYSFIVTNEEQAQNFAVICKIKPDMQMCLDYAELLETSENLHSFFLLWQIDFFFYWWIWVWQAVDDVITNLKSRLSSSE